MAEPDSEELDEEPPEESPDAAFEGEPESLEGPLLLSDPESELLDSEDDFSVDLAAPSLVFDFPFLASVE